MQLTLVLSDSLLCCLSLLTLTPASYGAEDPLLQEALAGHATSIGAIRTLYAKVNLRIEYKSKVSVLRSEYWRDANVTRVREWQANGTLVEALLEHGEQKAVYKYPGSKQNTFLVNMVIADEYWPIISTDAWELALLQLPTLKATKAHPPRLSIPEAVKRLKVTRVVNESTRSGKLLRLSLAGPKSNESYDVWLDPSVNWLVRKVIHRIEKSELPGWDCEFEVGEFTEVVPAVYFPARVTASNKFGDTVSRYNIAFTDVSINRLNKSPIPLALPIPAGIKATDRIKGVTYTVDSQGHPTSRPQLYRELPALPLPKPDPNAHPQAAWFSLHYLALFGVGVAALLAVLFRRYYRPG